MSLGGFDFNIAALGYMRQFVHAAALKLPYLSTGGFCVVSPASPCVDFLFDFVALCGCIGADGAYAVAAIIFCPSQPSPHAGSASTFAIWRRGGTASARPGSRTGTGSRGHGASDHQGHRTEA